MATSLASPASAQVDVGGRTLDLHVERGATCLDQDLLADELAVWIKGVAIPAGLSVSVLGSPDDPRTVITRVRYPDGTLAERTFSPAPTFCPYLHQAVALSLSLALKAAGGKAVATGGLDAAGDDVPAAPAEPRSLGNVELGLGPAIATGVIGRIGVGAAAQVAWAWRYASVRIEPGVLHAPRTELVRGLGAYQLDVFWANVGGCGRLPLGGGKVEAEACALFSVAHVDVDQTGTNGDTSTSRTLWGLTPTFVIQSEITGNFVIRAAAGLLAVSRPLRISARDEATNFVASDDLGRLGGLFSVSLGYRIAIRSSSR